MEILIHYILPNIALFGGIYVFGKVMENAVWHFVSNYDSIVSKMKG